MSISSLSLTSTPMECHEKQTSHIPSSKTIAHTQSSLSQATPPAFALSPPLAFKTVYESESIRSFEAKYSAIEKKAKDNAQGFIAFQQELQKIEMVSDEMTPLLEEKQNDLIERLRVLREATIDLLTDIQTVLSSGVSLMASHVLSGISIKANNLLKELQKEHDFCQCFYNNLFQSYKPGFEMHLLLDCKEEMQQFLWDLNEAVETGMPLASLQNLLFTKNRWENTLLWLKEHSKTDSEIGLFMVRSFIETMDALCTQARLNQTIRPTTLGLEIFISCSKKRDEIQTLFGKFKKEIATFERLAGFELLKKHPYVFFAISQKCRHLRDKIVEELANFTATVSIVQSDVTAIYNELLTQQILLFKQELTAMSALYPSTQITWPAPLNSFENNPKWIALSQAFLDFDEVRQTLSVTGTSKERAEQLAAKHETFKKTCAEMLASLDRSKESILHASLSELLAFVATMILSAKTQRFQVELQKLFSLLRASLADTQMTRQRFENVKSIVENEWSIINKEKSWLAPGASFMYQTARKLLDDLLGDLERKVTQPAMVAPLATTPPPAQPLPSTPFTFAVPAPVVRANIPKTPVASSSSKKPTAITALEPISIPTSALSRPIPMSLEADI